MRLIDADALKRRAQRVATEAWKMNLTAKIETTLNQFIDWINDAPTIERGNGLLLDMRLCALPRIQSADGQDYVQLSDVLETLHTFAKWLYRRGESR